MSSRGNEIDPALLQNAHLVGQPRTPTASEVKQMNKEAIMLAVMQVAGTALSSLLESGPSHYYDPVTNSDVVLEAAKALLKKSDETQNDFDGHIGKRKLRNQLAAQLVYSTLRGGEAYKQSVIDNAFDAATKIIKGAESYANEEVEKTTPTSNIIAT